MSEEANGFSPDLPVLMITIEQAAAMAQTSYDRIREWSFEADFPVLRDGHLVRIHARLFDEWLAKRSQRGEVAA